MAFPAVPALPSTKPTEYWKDTTLRLANGSLNEKGAKAKKKTANVPHNYVSNLQANLITLGYLKAGADDGSYGPGTERAVKKFQRHAKRSFRMLLNAKHVEVPWVGTVTGVVDPSTAAEVRKWVDKGYRLPFNLYKITSIDGGECRDDVAKLWKAAIDDVAEEGRDTPAAGRGGRRITATLAESRGWFQVDRGE